MSSLAVMTWAWAAVLAQLPGAPPPLPLPHPALPPPDPIEPPLPWWIYLAAGVLLLLLTGMVVWLLLRPKPVPPLPVRQPWSSAVRALNDLRSRVEGIRPPDVSHRVSEIMRRYLFDRYAVPAMARTTREIFEGTPDRVPGVPIPRAQGLWRERFEPVANLCDQMSFMPAPRTPQEAEALIDQALARLEEEKP